MKTPSETTAVPAVDGKEEPEPNLALPSGMKVPKKKRPKRPLQRHWKENSNPRFRTMFSINYEPLQSLNSS